RPSIPRPPTSTLFPYTTLFRSPLFVTTLAPLLILTIGGNQVVLQNMTIGQLLFSIQIIGYLFNPLSEVSMLHAQIVSQKPTFDRDRKSTRLNSSHVSISYAVFC